MATSKKKSSSKTVKTVEGTTVEPVKACTIRYDKEHGRWCKVNKEDPKEILEVINVVPAYLADVTFETFNDSRAYSYGCGPAKVERTQIGLATGTFLTERPKELSDAVPCNLQFKDGGFSCNSGPLTKARFLRLSDERFATVYI